MRARHGGKVLPVGAQPSVRDTTRTRAGSVLSKRLYYTRSAPTSRAWQLDNARGSGEGLGGAQAVCTRVVVSHGAPWRVRVERRWPALSSRRGHKPSQE